MERARAMGSAWMSLCCGLEKPSEPDGEADGEETLFSTESLGFSKFSTIFAADESSSFAAVAAIGAD